jgi:bacterial leucyl aminopeptidase
MLRSVHVRLGILSNRGAIPEEDVMDVLAHVGLLPLFERNLILFGAKDSPLLFEQAAARVAISLEMDEQQPALLFVGEDALERACASKADFLVEPHPKPALPALLHQGAFRYLRIRIPTTPNSSAWREMLREMALVPLHLSFEQDGTHRGVNVYAIADTTTALKLDNLGFWVDRLGVDDEPLLADLYTLRNAPQEDRAFLNPIGSAFTPFKGMPGANRVLTSTHEGLFISIPAGRSVESYHFPGTQHGHTLKLLPTIAVLESTKPEENERLIGTQAVDLTPPTIGGATAMMLTKEEKKILKAMITSRWISRDVRRYSGSQPAATTTTILSRHIHHTGNTDAVRLLCDDLNRMGANALHVRTHRFMHEGRSYQNVEATLPASGLPGIVLITAHLDSTGARQAGYRASVDPAPGADDDASGISGVLVAARAILRLDAVQHVPVGATELIFLQFTTQATRR